MSNPRVVVEFISQGVNQVTQATRNVQSGVASVGNAASTATPQVSAMVAAIGPIIKIGTVAVGVLAALGAGSLILANRTADMAEASQDLARKLGITTKEWERQKRVLGSITNKEGKDTFELLKNLREQQVQAATEGGKSEKAFNALGIAFRNADGSLVPLETLLDSTLEALRALPGPMSQTVAANQLFGESMAGDVLKILESTSEEMAKTGEKAEELGLLIGDDLVAHGKRFNDRFNLVGETLRDIIDLVGQYLLVNINSLVDSFIEFYNTNLTGRFILAALINGLLKTAEAIAKGIILIGFFGRTVSTVFKSSKQIVVSFFEGLLAASKAFFSAMATGDFMGAAGKGLDAFNSKMLEGAESIHQELQGLTEDYNKYTEEKFKTLEDFIKKTELTISNSINRLSRTSPDPSGGLSAPAFGGASDVSAASDLHGMFNAKDAKDPKQSLQDANQEIGIMNRYSDKLKKNTLALASAWGDVGTNIADVATDSIVYLADGMTNAITGMITGTQTLAESFQQMAVSIIRSIVQMIVQWIVFALIVAPIMSMLTWGASTGTAAAGSASMFGMISSAASTGAAFGASQATTAKADGGLIEGGMQLALVNERGKEFVFSAEAVQNLGVGFLENLHAQASGITAGIPAGSSMPAPNVNVSPSEATVIIVNDRAELLKTLASRAGQKITVHNIRGNRIKAGIPT